MRFMAALAGAALLLGGCSMLAAPTADVGDCIDLDVNSTSVTELEGFECSEEHDAEVYYKGDADIDGDYDALKVEEQAVDMCLTGFEEYVGIDYYSSVLDVYYVYPEAEGWGSGDREVICAVYTPDEAGEVTRTTGSLKDAQQ